MVRRGIASVQIILDYAREQGLDTHALLAGSDISYAASQNQDTEISPQQELVVLSNLLERIPDPFRLGVELGRRYQLTSYGIVGYAILSSPTLRKAAEVGLRYLALTFAYARIELCQQQHDVALTFTRELDGPLGQLVLVRDIWAVSVIQRELFSTASFPIPLLLDFAEPAYARDVGKATLEAQLGGAITFDADRCAYVGLADLLDLPLAKGNAITAQLCEDQCNKLLEEKQSWQATAQLVKNCLLHEGLGYSMEQVAAKLARTSRTLHRQLKQEGTSWREVRDQVRMGLAEELLAQPIQLEEIAERLGFSDGSNFTHSFKRFKGISPSAYRKHLSTKA